jgi:hypothetical protein
VKRALLLCLLVACAKKQEPPPPAKVPALTAEEIQRSQDACKTYVDKICACAEKVPTVKPKCDLAKALPEAVQIGIDVAANPDTKPQDIYGAQSSVRKAVKTCIEQTAQLPALGCP